MTWTGSRIDRHPVSTFLLTLTLIPAFLSGPAFAQQTVFNVPSADVLEKGKVYVELDVSTRFQDPAQSYEPRVVVGVGHRIEVGLNVLGFNLPGATQTTIAPTFKWKPYDNQQTGWAFLVGDDLLMPVQNRAYSAGNYLWAVVSKSWSATHTRITFGGYDFSAHVVAPANRAGGQFTFEQPISKSLTAAAEWWTGNHANGYLTPGLVWKASSKVTLYFAYPLANADVSEGNHYFLFELGINPN